jgi:hypothetical protein
MHLFSSYFWTGFICWAICAVLYLQISINQNFLCQGSTDNRKFQRSCEQESIIWDRWTVDLESARVVKERRARWIYDAYMELRLWANFCNLGRRFWIFGYIWNRYREPQNGFDSPPSRCCNLVSDSWVGDIYLFFECWISCSTNQRFLPTEVPTNKAGPVPRLNFQFAFGRLSRKDC